MLPVFRPLKDPAVATVWSGLAASTIGEDLFRVAVVWIAAEKIGNAAGYVNAAQYGAMLVVGLLGASAFDRWRADRAMIGAKLASAVLALMPVAGFYVWGISIPLLVLAVMGLAALRMVFTPALQSAVPVLVPDRDAMQAINGLFDATWRLARLIGPMLAAVLNSLLPQAPAPAPVIVQAPKPTNWLMWGGIAAAVLVGLVVIKSTMRKGGGSSAPAPTATNPRRRRKVRISRRRRH